MISNLTPSNEAFIAAVQRVQRKIDDANRQTATGKRVNVASDAPSDVDAILQLRTDEARNKQIQSNLAIADTDAKTADSALSSATQLLDRATTLATQGANFTLDATGRKSLASEVQSLLEQLVSISNTTVQGRYVFGGDQDTTPPYDVDLNQANGVARLTGAVATRRLENAAGGTFSVAISAQDIFDARNPDDTLASGNVFAALNSLRLGLLNNDTTQISAATNSIQLAADHLNVSQAYYGTIESRISDASNFSSSYDVQLKTELSQKQDADITSAAMAITQGNIQLQAAFQMQAKMPHTTLFDFMG